MPKMIAIARKIPLAMIFEFINVNIWNYWNLNLYFEYNNLTDPLKKAVVSNLKKYRI